MYDRVSLDEKFAQFSEHWSPKVVGELNGQMVKVAKLRRYVASPTVVVAKFQGAFVWHRHDAEDELFLVHRGRFRLEFRDRVVELAAGDFMIVPRGVEHRPVADEEVEVVLFEPASTLNTGTVRDERTLDELERL